jgi:hypothetical protein
MEYMGFYQLADSMVLLGGVGCVLVFLAHDPYFQHYFLRSILVVLGIGLFSQAMFLLGVWVPGVTGFPWPRLTIDASLLAVGIARCIRVIRADRRLRAIA